MINTFILEGKITEISEVKETERGNKFVRATLKVDRNFRNSEGIYDFDFIEIELWRGIAEVFIEGSHIDDFISIQGRIQTSKLKTNEGKEFIAVKLVAEKVSFLR